MAQSNVHDRHPQEGEDFDTSERQDNKSKSKFNWPGKDAKEQQATRDAHFYENSVKADLTGGKAPKER